jgi:vacuolar protein sorting-associated protein 13D
MIQTVTITISFFYFHRTSDDSECNIQPAHTISLLSPLVVVNLLPYELLWELKAVSQSGIIKPGKSTSIHTVNVSAGFQIAFRTENFVHSSDLVIGTSPHNFSTRLRLYDSANRLLLLQVNFHIHLSYEFLIFMLLYILF